MLVCELIKDVIKTEYTKAKSLNVVYGNNSCNNEEKL